MNDDGSYLLWVAAPDDGVSDFENDRAATVRNLVIEFV